MALTKITIIVITISCFFAFSCTKQHLPVVITSTDPMVQKFYTDNQRSFFWCSSKKDRKKAAEWLTEMESANSFGFVSDQLQIDQLRLALVNIKEMNDSLKNKTDQQITGLVLNFLKELQQGSIKFDYDEVTIPRDSVYIYQLRKFKTGKIVSEFVSLLECKDAEYSILKKYLNDSITVNDTLKYKALIVAMNYRKFLSVNHQSEYMFVNIAAAEAIYYKDDIPAMKMRTVPGAKSRQTPTIASYITGFVTFPFWNVPREIAVNELLPKIKKDSSYLEKHNFDVVDAKGFAVNDSLLNWETYTAQNFPYYFRQATGSGNSLGVIKFNLENPFSIYLHDTSNQTAFKKNYRFLSHGCIRLENPLGLANAFLPDTIDMKELFAGKKDTKSNTIILPKKIPTYILYTTVNVINNHVTFLPDVYGLIK
ncbi:MAG: L,D-transpeptidase family protein [Prolixibacteraceae bacterium]